MNNNEIGQKIKTLRKQNNLTQEALASKINKTESSVRKYEKGLVEIPLSVLNDIANALGVAINTFLPPPLTPSQEILNEIIPSKYSLEEIATLANVPICELQAIYTGSQGSTVGTYFKLYSFLGLDETTILNIMMSDSCIDVAYNHDSSDPLKNALFKHYTEQPLTLDELLVSIADDDKPLIESLYYQGMIPNTDTYKAPIKSIPNTSILNTLGYTLKPTKNNTISITYKQKKWEIPTNKFNILEEQLFNKFQNDIETVLNLLAK